MCGNTSTLVYSPRRLVALAADGGGTATRSGAADGAGGAQPGGGPEPQEPRDQPNPDAFVRNLKVPMPLGRKLKLVVRNTAIKFKTRQNCCGHPGEPGC
jgi:hypothetical protein